MIISISGLPGSGKSTVSKILSEKLGFEPINMGAILRKLADQKGISILELMKEAETDGSIDEDADEMVSDLGRNSDNLIIDSRTAFHFIPDSLKIFLKVDLKVGAKRIFRDLKKEERNEEEKATTIDKLFNKLKERTDVDRGRYEKYYGIDFMDESNYDLVIDSSKITAQEVANKILVEVEKMRENEEQEKKQEIEADI